MGKMEEEMKEIINMNEDMFLDVNKESESEEGNNKVSDKEESSEADIKVITESHKGKEETTANLVPKQQLHTFRLFEEDAKSLVDPKAYYHFMKGYPHIVQCSSCNRTYKSSTRVDTLIRHLNKKHGVFGLPGDDNLKAAFLMPTTGSKFEDRKNTDDSLMEEAIVRWILSDSLSLSSLESPAFLNMLKLVAPGVQLPSRDRLRELFTNMLQAKQAEAQLEAPTDAVLQDFLTQADFVDIIPEPIQQEPVKTKRRKTRVKGDFQFVTFENREFN